MHPFFGRLVVNFVLCLICFIAYSSQIFIIWPWYGSVISVELLTLLVPFNIFVGLLLWNYFLCVFTDPGRVPNGYKPDTHTDGYEVKKLTGAPRFCRMCNNYKPPRAHHCRQCNRCVVLTYASIDHHCPWINNCVGHFNYGHFIRFLFWVDVACSYHITMVTKRVFYSMGARYWDEPDTLELVMIIMNYVACIPVLLAVGALNCSIRPRLTCLSSLYHFYSLAGNSTTIEGWEKDKRSVMVKKGRAREVKFAYVCSHKCSFCAPFNVIVLQDLGRRRNIESILGQRPLLWCCPTRTPGTGLRYELSSAEGEILPNPESTSESSSVEGTDITHNLSPWTFENESLNPALRPSNSQLRTRRRRIPQNNIPGASALPPYHPDYQEGEQQPYEPDQYSEDSESSADEKMAPHAGQHRVRRGSEGYEIRQEGREEMLRKYLEELGEEPGRYVRYIPQVEDDSASDEDEDNTPLAHIAEKVRFSDTAS
ncbi:DHHC palmitoyltransferase-domain-containing protein [Flammula alnicola]|nr:DHHC palmitoyltransferase-domain-containing protein [Flammula alnicola]